MSLSSIGNLKMVEKTPHLIVEFSMTAGASLIKAVCRFDAWPKEPGQTAREMVECLEPLIERNVLGDTTVRGTPALDMERLNRRLKDDFQGLPDHVAWQIDDIELSPLPQNGEHMRHLQVPRTQMAWAY